MQLENRDRLLDSFKFFINTTTPRGGKAIIDLKSNILLANDLNLIFTLEEGTDLLQIFPDRALALSTKKMRQSIQSNKHISQNVSLEMNGVNHWFQVRVTPIVDGEDPLFVVDFEDITDFKAIEAAAAKQRARIETELLLRTKEIVQTDLFTRENGGFLTNFMRGLRHDLLSPVAQLKDIINYYIEAEDPKKKEKAQGLMEQSLQKLSNTVKGFSEFIDLHILPQSNLEAISIEAIFSDIQGLLSNEIGQSRAQISSDFSKADQLYFNKKIMSSIVYNLLSNAIKFKKEDVAAVIQVSTYWEDNDFVFSIKDNGRGIDLEKNGHQLFVPFKRLNMDRPGNGIGLSMIKNILTQYNGTITLESKINQGTTALVRLPKIINKVEY